ncbi:CdaR family protein [Winogradskyella sp. PG-2]|uniref:CdaR family protein n=1 Tax=Winogradskyella sp. PG-2 TaxID=754409 RepID=UPI000458863B|nr:CdaR family protein [Winogradskyella sp. PG-2]BAO77730.1 hypothetical protein WPG_3500 [Winogradskyella sp. PG-2]
MNTKKKFNISDYLKRKNVKRFSIFFVIATVFLIFSKLSTEYKQTIKLKVKLVNLEDEIILQNDSLNTISAYIETKGFSLLPLMFKDYKDIILDVKTDVTSIPNQFVFDVQKHQFLIEGQLGESYKLLSVKPDTLLLSYSKSESKLVPITLNSEISYAIGYDLKGNFEFNCDSVKIVGAKDQIDEISSIDTELLELKEVNTDISETIKLNTSEYDAIEIFPKFVSIKGEIARFTEGTVEVPVTLINKPNGLDINYFPKTVSLSYYVDLDNYNSIRSTDFSVVCDYLGIEDNQTFFVPKISKKPEFIKRIGIKQKRVDFIKL